jgi:hypothetical protein
VDFKEFAIMRNASAGTDFFRNARALPEDKLDWRPNPEMRSVLEIAQEVAQSPSWGVQILANRGWGGPTNPEEMQAAMEQAMAEQRSWDTLDKCESVMQSNLEKLAESIRAFPEEELTNTVHLPFGAGMTLQLAEICMVQNWNATYHLGQICYVQLMNGDKEMH